MTRAWRDVGAHHQDGEAEGGDDELGADEAAGDAGDGLADGEVEDEAGGQEDGEKDEGLDVELAVVGGAATVRAAVWGVLGHGSSFHDSDVRAGCQDVTSELVV